MTDYDSDRKTGSDYGNLDRATMIAVELVKAGKVEPDSICRLLRDLIECLENVEDKSSLQTSAVSPEDSIHREYIVCLEDGAKVKILSRYIKRFGLTPEEYRKKWDLPSDYPMVAPAHSEERRRIAKDAGLGRKKS